MKNTSFLWFYAFVLSWLAVKFGWGLNINGKAGSVISLFRSTESPSAKVKSLVSLTEGMRYGVNKANNEEIIAIIARLKENIENSNIMTQQTKYEKLLYGNWRLAWTTEKETLLFAEKGFFGKSCTGISQYFNANEGVVNNIIKFEDSTSFVVDGKASADSEIVNRTNFKFSKATVEYQGFKVPLPPVGAGWFETIYVDDKYRVSYDIRGDYSIFIK